MRSACCIAPLVAAFAVVAACGVVSCDVSAQEAERFTHLAHDAQHTGTADSAGPSLLGTPRFVATVPDMDLVGPATPIVSALRVFVYADRLDPELQLYVGTYVLAFSELDGALLWSRQVADRRYDSWASPAAYFDEAGGESVIVSSGDVVYRLDAVTGDIAWSVGLDHTANASPVAADGKVFVTDYTGYGGGGKIYAFDAGDGAVLWSSVLGRTSGNTPAYADHVVYAGTGGGTVYAFDAGTGTEVWNAPLVSGTSKGFFGSVSVRGGALYIASYNFNGGEDNSLLFKLDAATGALGWTQPAACERTDSIPIVIEDRVYLAGGVYGYGSKRKIECFAEGTGALLWSYTGAGGWCHQPCYTNGLLYTGLIVSEGFFFGPAVDLQVLDVSKAPGEPGFVVDVYAACGSSPAIANANVYSIGLLDGKTALYAFGPPLSQPTAPVITNLATPGPGQFTLTWTTRHGVTYVVQCADGTALGAYDPAASWTDIAESQVTEMDGAPGDEGTESWTDDGTSSAGVSTTGSRFYRVRVAP
ncbi:MAG: PQQ-like beta-propeller repeat protein [Verrucomicrobia bacterium]|nr:PQQ-like beta-propeller repeat protein [Verrucomicrobiota bacterium]